jgi:hypothetical protein
MGSIDRPVRWGVPLPVGGWIGHSAQRAPWWQHPPTRSLQGPKRAKNAMSVAGGWMARAAAQNAPRATSAGFSGGRAPDLGAHNAEGEGEMSDSPRRRFMRPWKVIEHDESYEVQDAVGLPLASVYFENATIRQSSTRRLSKDEARRVAAQIARLPTLLRIEKGIDRGEA